jgi:DNA polymerase III alpha subunit
MYTYNMVNSEENIKTDLTDFHSYQTSKARTKQARIIKIYAPIQYAKNKVGFDIYDFEMIFNDIATKKIMHAGNTIGCFYIESPGMRSLLRRLDCDTFEMLTAASSIIRPGVAESGMMQEFIARYKDPERRKYLMPEMETHLGETYGVMIYQEDVIKVMHFIAGMTLEEADLLRRAMSGRLRSRTAMEKISGRFFESCRMKGLPQEIVQQLWHQIKSFAGYAFCKAHSASFAMLSFQMAYLKAHFPAEFMASVLSNRGGFYSASVYINEAKRMGVEILLPCINSSEHDYQNYGNSIRIGFMAIKNLEGDVIEKIVGERNINGKYISLADFLIRTKIKHGQSEILIKCGAMDCFNQTRPTLLRLLDIYFFHRNFINESHNDLFFRETLKLEKEVETKRQFSLEEICTAEYEAFDYMVTQHPLYFYKNVINSSCIIQAIDLYKYTGKKVKMIGWYMTSKRIKTRKESIMKFLTLEDLTGTFDAVMFPKTYGRYAELTMSMGPYLLEGKVDLENGNNIIVEKLEILSAKDAPSITQKDSAENKYYGETEKISEEEVVLVEKLGKEKLRRAYA